MLHCGTPVAASVMRLACKSDANIIDPLLFLIGEYHLSDQACSHVYSHFPERHLQIVSRQEQHHLSESAGGEDTNSRFKEDLRIVTF